jgi:hypothetical protein
MIVNEDTLFDRDTSYWIGVGDCLQSNGYVFWEIKEGHWLHVRLYILDDRNKMICLEMDQIIQDCNKKVIKDLVVNLLCSKLYC